MSYPPAGWPAASGHFTASQQSVAGSFAQPIPGIETYDWTANASLEQTGGRFV
jgi:hypothetical protein